MRFILLATVAMMPAVAVAQQVPALQANAAASAGITAAPPIGPAVSNAGGAAVVVPPGMPPANHPLSPSAPLNAKERSAATQAASWRNHNDKPSRGEDGTLRWLYGASLPSVVCAPLQVCDIALQPGETINSIHVGDKVRWSVMPGVTGFGGDRTTHIIVKPADAGLVTSLLVYTDKRTYSIKLISTQSQWTPMTAFNYAESAQVAWANYGATMTAVSGVGTEQKSGGSGPVDLDYQISGSASWKPEHVYAQGGKTYIKFPSTMQYGSAPALVGLASDGGWFSSPSEQMVRYRIAGNQYVVDSVIDHAMLVEGVGGGQTRVDIRRVH